MSLSTVLSLLTSSSSTSSSSSSSTGGVEEATTIITNTTTYTTLLTGLLSNKSNSSLIGRANEGVGRDYNGNDNNTTIPISPTSLLANNLTMRRNSSGDILGNKNSSDFYFDNTTTAAGEGTTGDMNMSYGSTTEGPSFLERTEEYTPLFYFLTTILMFVYVYVYFLNKYERKKAEGTDSSKKGSESRWARNVLSENSDVLDDDDVEVSDATVKFPVQRPQPPQPAAPEASELGLMSSWRI